MKQKMKTSKAVNIQVVGLVLRSMVWGGWNLHYNLKDLTMFGFATTYDLEADTRTMRTR